MSPIDPKQLLQIIHDRGEEATVSGRVHDQARAATQELVKWLDEHLAKDAAALAASQKAPPKKTLSFPPPVAAPVDVKAAQ
jgi:hypothetical protein